MSSKLPQEMQTYRPDIDGLRAVAVGLIIVFHLAEVFPGGLINRLSGGYIGVDVFFVISGYLITGIVLKEARVGSFTLSRFYDRRIRRIVPALACMLFLVTIPCAYLMLPIELQQYSWSMLFSLFSLSNVYFFFTSGYFAAPAETRPLLHTWSLAVEEQFYIVWPLILTVCVKRWPLRLPVIVLSLGLCSLVLNLVLVSVWPDFTFYLVFTRAWEFCAGGALSLGLLPPCRGVLRRNVMSVLGLAAIIGPAFELTAQSPFPGANAVLPCLGSVLIISAGMHGWSLVGLLLSTSPLRFLGRISYSLYLWHWPIMVLQKMFVILPGREGGYQVKAEILLSCGIAALLSWWFVERPFRTLVVPSRVVFQWGACTIGSLVLLGAVTTGGLSSRFSARAVQVGSFLDYGETHIPECQLAVGQQASLEALGPCLSRSATRKNVLLLGDSHSRHLLAGLKAAFADTNFMTATSSGCTPREEGLTGRDGCGSLYELIYTSILNSNGVDGIILGGRWGMHTMEPYQRFVAWASQKRIPLTVFGPIVSYDQALPRLLAMADRYDDPGRPGRHVLPQKDVDDLMSAVARSAGAHYVSLQQVMCPAGACENTLANGDPIQFDYGHLTAEGSVHLIHEVAARSVLTQTDLTTNARPADRPVGDRGPSGRLGEVP